MRAIAYTYDADVHCIACTQARFNKRRLAHMPTSPDCYDENGIDINQRDREGNLLHPVFSTDEFSHFNCGDCQGEL